MTQNTAPAAFSVEGKVAIITGAGSGINYEFAKLLLSKNCSVVIGDLSLRPEAQALVDNHSSSPRCLFQKTDVTDWTSLQALFQLTVSEFGTYDLVCPGAGIFEPHWSNFWHPPGAAGSTSKDPTSGFGHYACLDINVTHPIRATQIAIAEFLKPSDGSPKASASIPKRVVHTASVASQIGNLPTPLYIASKHAINGFIRSLGPLEQTLGIRVNGVMPGAVKTPLWTDHPEKMSFLDASRDDYWVSPAEVAENMLRMVVEPEMVGGTMLEVSSSKKTRIVPLFGNEGPPRPSTQGSTATNGIPEVYEWLKQEGWGKMVEEGS